MSRPTTSVLLPASGAGRLLAAAIDRVLAQSLLPDELIIAVAARDTAALNTAQGYAARHPDRIVLRSYDGPAGLAHDLDRALRAARGDMVALADADEIWPDDYLARTVAALDAGGAYCCFAATAGSELSTLGLGGRGYVFLRRALARAGDIDTTLSLFPHWELAARIALSMPVAQLDVTINTVSASRGYAPAVAMGEAQRILRQHASCADPATRDRIVDELEDLMADLASAPLNAERSAALLELPYHAPATGPGGRLLFLASLPRSGSTLLQRMFAGHPDVHSLPEPWVMLHPAFGLRQADIEADYEPALAARAVGEFSDRCGDPELQVEAIRAGTDRLYDEALNGSGCPFFLDKTPRYFHILPELKRIYPAAAIMLLLRHPLAVFASTLAAWHEDDPERLFDSPNYRDLLDGPRLLLEALKEPANGYTIVRYEELVSDPAPQLERLCVAAGLPYWDGMLALAESRLPRSETFGDPGNAWTTSGPETTFMDAWQSRLEQDPRLRDAATRYIAELGAEVFEQLGYPLTDAWITRSQMVCKSGAQAAPATSSVAADARGPAATGAADLA
ncbi:MAG: glycosyltransferase, partial [Gammaproteobacteria bacterium]|nr:sulfotransferase [Gammaproteobacteria bacterium]NNM00328.1 glycosyltransferase [Gammaproteobacteria bacterium]